MNRARNLGAYAAKQDLPERFYSKVACGAPNHCWMWTDHADSKGYGLLSVDGKVVKAHRIAWMLAFGGIPTGLQVCHACDNPGCVNPNHLLLGTSRANTMDKVKKGRQSRCGPNNPAKGDFHGMAVLAEPDVRNIIAGRNNWGFSYMELAKQYGVSKGTIASIFQGRNWKHITGENENAKVCQ